MCDPVSIAGAVMAVGSTVVNYIGQRRVEAARNDALSAERTRQKTLDREADALNLRSRNRYDDFEGQEEQRATQLGDFFTGQRTQEPSAAEAPPESSSDIVVREEQKQRGKAREFTDKTGNALGELRAFGDLLGGIGRTQARDASLVDQVGGFKRGAAGVLPLELDDANRAGDMFKLFGDILGGAGGLFMGGIGGGGGKAATPQLPGSVGVVPTPRPTSAMAGTIPTSTPRPVRLGHLYGPQ